ncbi:4167_t:CDS:2 [Cetraspora pellucida]|uniref:4167_t:CDS:1 n=1 Tax=Cetraspora pellucida TaxID=1433469 RepID=A0A9N9BH43_9GLOM|nr:4167_t:CDS:2 [Cetraspora pellucida]
MSDESTTNAKKSRSLSDAERRLMRRQKRILNNANGRLERITATHSSTTSLNTESTSTLTSRNVSPQLSQRSSPVTTESPDSIFSLRRNTETFEPLPPPLNSDSTIQPSPDRPSFTPIIRVNNDSDPQRLFHQRDQEHPSVSTLTGDDDHNGYFENDEQFRRELTNLRAGNSSTTSLASTIGTTSEYPPGSYPPSISHEDLAIYDEINAYCQQQQQSMPPLPFLSFLSPDLISPGQQQSDVQSKLWQLIHFFAMIMLGLLAIGSEVFRHDGTWSRLAILNYKKPNEIVDSDRVSSLSLFWYFVTIELILQSSRLFLQKDRTFGGSALGTIAANLPPPLSDVLTVLLRYNLIWNSLWEDICMLLEFFLLWMK